MSVYFVQSGPGGRIKIGYSPYPERRIAYIQRYNGQELITLAVIEGSRGLEHALHQLLADHRAHGEWFEPAPAVLDVVRRASLQPQDWEGRVGRYDLSFSDDELTALAYAGKNCSGAADRARRDPYSYNLNIIAGMLLLFPEEARAA